MDTGIETVGVVGAGTMGAGIAQLALEAGHVVLIHDVDAAAIERGRARVRLGLTRRAAGLGLDADSIDDWVEGRLGNLRPAATLDALADDTGLVVEAALEDLAAKRAIFATLDQAAPADAILATNTSALSVGTIGAATHRPSRVLGLHFFNPAPVMPLVEVVSATSTDPDVTDRAVRIVEAWGRTTVRCADSPGFIVNRVNRPFTIEALRLAEGGVAIEAIDAAIRDGGFPMGPFELMDLIGVDVNLAVARAVWDGLGRPERLAPSPIQERLVAAGQLGRKTGAGFYRYEDGRRLEVAAPVSAVDAVAPASDKIRSRILDVIGQEARLALADGVATEDDIDLALRLGAAHPVGPFERERAARGTMPA